MKRGSRSAPPAVCAEHGTKGCTLHDGQAPASTPPELQEVLVPIDDVEPDPDQPRKHFDDEQIQELAESIRSVGLLQAVVVRRVRDPRTEDGPPYRLVAGERRWRAAALAGLDRVPARILVGLLDEDVTAAQLAENMARQNLGVLEEADAIARLAELGWTQTRIGAAIGKSQPVVANKLRFRKLPEEVLQWGRAGQLSEAHLVALASYAEFPALAIALARRALPDQPSSWMKPWTAKELADKSVLANLHEPSLVAYVGETIQQRAGCRECPFGAFRLLQGAPYCLKPSHQKEIEAELAAEHTAELDRQKAAAVEAVRPAPRLIDTLAPEDSDVATPADVVQVDTEALPEWRYGGPFERLDNTYSDAMIPRECREGVCPCKGLARVGDTVVDVCTKPRRLQSLRAQATKARNAENARREAAAVQRVVQQVDEIRTNIGPRELTVITARLTQQPAYTPRGTDLLTAFGQAKGRLKTHDQLVRAITYVTDTAEGLEQLSGESSVAQTRFLVEAILRADLALLFHPEGNSRAGVLARWYLGDTTICRVPNTWEPREERPSAKAPKGKATRAAEPEDVEDLA